MVWSSRSRKTPTTSPISHFLPYDSQLAEYFSSCKIHSLVSFSSIQNNSLSHRFFHIVSSRTLAPSPASMQNESLQRAETHATCESPYLIRLRWTRFYLHIILSCKSSMHPITSPTWTFLPHISPQWWCHFKPYKYMGHHWAGKKQVNHLERH